MRSFTLVGSGFVLGAILFIGASLVVAWTGPSSAPPSGNVSAPVNIGSTDQVKNAGLSVNALAVFGNAILSGASRYLNFGTTAGASGYGIRDNAGTIEAKNNGGNWASIALPTCANNGATLQWNASSQSWQCVEPNTTFTVSTSANNLNLYTIAGSPTNAGAYTVTINPNVTVGSANISTAALVSGNWPAGTSVKLVNYGTIQGAGGLGGHGGGQQATGGSPGGAGGDALSLSSNVTIDNTSGFIYGGGGGGGGGANPCGTNGGGGGGGGGAGTVVGGIQGGGGDGAGNGSPGTASAGGAGGAGVCGGSGGNGGNPGVAGAAGYNNAGGAAGKAIVLNGKTVTWLGGNDSTHVKGLVQ